MFAKVNRATMDATMDATIVRESRNVSTSLRINRVVTIDDGDVPFHLLQQYIARSSARGAFDPPGHTQRCRVLVSSDAV